MATENKSVYAVSPTGYLVFGTLGAIALWKIGKAIFSNDNSGGTSTTLPEQGEKTYTDDQYKIFADGIETGVWGTGPLGVWTEDDEAIGDILMQMNTLGDVIALNNAYGIRTRGIILSDGGNLVQTINNYLDSDVKSDVNEDYRNKNILWVWP